MSVEHPWQVAPDCPACGDEMVPIVWPDANPDSVDTDCWWCGVDVRVYRDGRIERR